MKKMGKCFLLTKKDFSSTLRAPIEIRRQQVTVSPAEEIEPTFLG